MESKLWDSLDGGIEGPVNLRLSGQAVWNESAEGVSVRTARLGPPKGEDRDGVEAAETEAALRCDASPGMR